MNRKFIRAALIFVGLVGIGALFAFFSRLYLIADARAIHVSRAVASEFSPFDLERARSRQLIRILVINGGGIRGLIPIEVLNYLEQKTHKPISQLFDMVVVTSTGGIIGGFLLMPDKNGHPKYSASKLLGLYQFNAKQVFSRSWVHRFFTLNGWMGPKYQNRNKASVLHWFFSNTRFDQLLLPTVIMGYSTNEQSPVIFRNWESWCANYPLWAIVDATTAAPTYFAPVDLIDKQTHKTLTLVDGGIFAHDPALTGLMEAVINFPHKHYMIVDLGTGKHLPQTHFQSMVGWGEVTWIRPLILTMLNAQSVNIVDVLQKLAARPDILNLQMYAFNISLPQRYGLTDNITPVNIDRLRRYGAQLIKKHRQQLDKVAHILVTSH